jgi:hypothetical protein
VPVEGSLPVAYTGIVPDMFAEGRDVIIEGRYVDGVLQAHAVMTSCPSKYEPKPGDAAQAAAGGSGRRAPRPRGPGGGVVEKQDDQRRAPRLIQTRWRSGSSWGLAACSSSASA